MNVTFVSFGVFYFLLWNALERQGAELFHHHSMMSAETIGAKV
jgi:hypothetical protein